MLNREAEKLAASARGAPLAVAVSADLLRRLVVRIDGTMLIGRFCLFVGWASATIQRRVAIDVVEERAAAVGDPAMQDAHVAAFADRRAVGPVATGRENREAAQPRGGRLGGGLAQRGEGTLTTGERAHLIWLS